MKRARYILRYFHVPTLSWMGGRCYDDLGRAADDYVKLATKSRDSVSRVEIYDHGSDPQYRAVRSCSSTTGRTMRRRIWRSARSTALA
jgi:hypothetical protein